MRCRTSAWAVVAASILVVTAARAQESPMPDAIAKGLIEIGRNVDTPKTAELYAPLQEKEPYQGVRIERDIKYGPAERNLLDVFVLGKAPIRQCFFGMGSCAFVDLFDLRFELPHVAARGAHPHRHDYLALA